MLTQAPGRPADVMLRCVRLVDPSAGIDEHLDVSIRGGTIAALGHHLSLVPGQRDVDCAHLTAMPAFVDPHVHIRVPGGESVENVASATRAAVRGGYCTIVSMPNTDPVVDTPEIVRALQRIAQEEAACAVGFAAAISKSQRSEQLTEMLALADAGAVLLSDDGHPVASPALLRRAFQYQAVCGLPFALHCEDMELTGGGSMHEGPVSARLGIAGIPAVGEWVAVARDLRIALAERGRVHIQHLTTRQALEEVEHAVALDTGAVVTCEVTPHHLLLTDGDVEGSVRGELVSAAKINPPLRPHEHREALLAGLRSGVIDCIGSDHAPHPSHRKQEPFERAPFGTIGLESTFPMLFTGLVQPGLLTLDRLVEALSAAPARILGIDRPRVETGALAQLTVFDLTAEWTIDGAASASLSDNCVFDGRSVRGRCEMTIAGGVIAHDAARQAVPA